MFPFSALIAPVAKLLDKIIPDADQRQQAKVRLVELEQQGGLDELRTEMSAILAEAGSADPWTSRARPTFLYVIYVLLLLAVPFGIVRAVSPAAAAAIVDGFHAWLAAIPDSLYTLFGGGYLGYAGARTVDKLKGNK